MKTFLVTHETKNFGPPHALNDFFIRHSQEHYFLTHPLSAADGQQSWLRVYRDKKIQHQRLVGKWSGNELVRFWGQLRLNQKIIKQLSTVTKFDLIVAANNLNVFSLGQFLKRCRSRTKTVYYTVDYSPKRFRKFILDALYQWLDRRGVATVDAVWSITRRAARRCDQYPVKPRFNLVVHNGVFISKIGVLPQKKSTSGIFRLVHHGSITASKGIQDIIQAIAMINDQAVTLDVFGEGPYLSKLKDMTKKLGMEQQIVFQGQCSNDQILEKLPAYDCGIAVYNLNDEYNRYCDPMKIREYLACGLPVIVSNVPEVAEHIKREQTGIVIDQKFGLVQAITKLKNNAYRDELRQNVIRTRLHQDWDDLFKQALRKMSINV